MLSLVVAVAVGLLAGVITGIAFSWWAGVLPALVVGGGLYVYIVFRTNKLVNAAMPAVMAAAQKRDIDGAVAILQSIKKRFAQWAPFLGSQIDGQIGAILFMKKDFEKARPYLDAAFVRSWDAKLMLGVLLSGALDPKKVKKQELTLAPVDDLLEKTVRFTDKQGLLWSTWAWLHWTNGNTSKALAILARGKEKLGDADQHIAANIAALQNDKKMKMKGYGDSWYSLHLEEHPAIFEQRRQQNVRFQPRR